MGNLKEMTNEEKAKEILKQFNFNGSHPGNKVYGFTLDRMKQIAVWKEQQMIEKTIDWLKDQQEMVGVSFQDDFYERFKEAINRI